MSISRSYRCHTIVTLSSLRTTSLFSEIPSLCSSMLTETFAPARFNFALPPSPTRVRTAWISDVHLGTRASGAARLLDFLREYDFETLYVVGDLIYIWQMRRSRCWPQQHNDVIQKILRKGTRVIYIPGNHDEMISSF